MRRKNTPKETRFTWSELIKIEQLILVDQEQLRRLGLEDPYLTSLLAKLTEMRKEAWRREHDDPGGD